MDPERTGQLSFATDIGRFRTKGLESTRTVVSRPARCVDRPGPEPSFKSRGYA